MKNIEVHELIITGLVIILILIGVYYYAHDKGASSITPIYKIDTVYSKVRLDSITKHIDKKDSIIYELKIKTKDDIEKSYLLDDSSSIELFKKLVSE